MVASNAKIVCLFLTIMLMGLFSTIMDTRGSIRNSTELSSYGLVSHEPLSDGPLRSGPLPYTGIGGDYCLIYDSGDVERWITWGTGSQSWVEAAAAFKPNYHTAALGFEFNSVEGGSKLDYTKFRKVLEIFDAAGLDVIAYLIQQPYAEGYAFSSEYWNDWISFAYEFKGDGRIAAFSLYSEFVPENLPADKTLYDAMAKFADLTRAIHTVDPNRVVIFPTGQLCYDYAIDWIVDIQNTGIVREPNVVFDVVHPYFFENSWDMGLTPEQKAVWYSNNWIAPCVNAFGANRCYGGETFAWFGRNDNLQRRWLAAIISEYAAHNVGFTVWGVLGGAAWYNLNIQGILASNYR